MNSRLVVLIFACVVLLMTIPLTIQSHAADSGEFKGGWIANGTRELFPLGSERQVYTFKIAGHVDLHNTTIGKKKDFWAECVGLSDTVTGVVGRCVWEDFAGHELYLTLQSNQLLQGIQVAGTIVGGTGQFAGISGELSFNWSSVILQTDAEGIANVSGHSKNLVGHYRVP